jgi:hypothetical protein
LRGEIQEKVRFLVGTAGMAKRRTCLYGLKPAFFIFNAA